MKQLNTILFPAIANYHRLLAAAFLVTASSNGIDKEVLSESVPWPGFIRRQEKWWMSCLGIGRNNPPVDIVAYYSEIDGSFIGDDKTARFLNEMGIQPQRNKDSHSVASVGWCEREQKWYGWSHRAIFGFGIGDDYYWPDTMFDGEGSRQAKRVIKNMDEARESASNFAEDVS